MLTSTLVAAAALVARGADGALLIPGWLAGTLSAPALVSWVHDRCRWFRRSSAAPAWTSEHALTSAVLMGAALLAVRFGSVEAASIAITAFLVGQLAIDGLAAAGKRVESLIANPHGLYRYLFRRWVVLVLITTVLLSLPVATRSGVPDYRHNFWQHVSTCGFAAASAATLNGVQIYSFAADFTLFGQALVILVVQLSGMALAAVGLAIVSPFLFAPMNLRKLWLTAIVLECVAALVISSAWRDEDVGGSAGRAGWSIVHAVGAIWNFGVVMRHDGLATYLTNPYVFSVITTLSILGSLGLPIVFDLIRGGTGSATRTLAPKPWHSLAAWESAATFVVLLSTALLLFMFETPQLLEPKFVPTRPLAFDENQSVMRDEADPGSRWRMAVFVAATMRSTGFQSMPMEQGAISWPSLVVILAGFLVGGTAAGVAGGFRLTIISLLGMCLFGSRAGWTGGHQDRSLRGELIRRAIVIGIVFMLINVATVIGLAATADGTLYERVFDGSAAASSAGMTAGLTLHLTWGGRLVMIGSMILGCWLPVRMWCGVSRAVTQFQAA